MYGLEFSPDASKVYFTDWYNRDIRATLQLLTYSDMILKQVPLLPGRYHTILPIAKTLQ
jgi:hypothetical protein